MIIILQADDNLKFYFRSEDQNKTGYFAILEYILIVFLRGISHNRYIKKLLHQQFR